jgi:hypothetical protein
LPAESKSVRAGSDAEARCALIGTHQSRQGRCASQVSLPPPSVAGSLAPYVMGSPPFNMEYLP